MTTTAPNKTPSPNREKTDSSVGNKPNPTMQFVGMSLDMSWRMAIAVLLPIIVANKLDNELGTKPWLTMLGFIIAVAGTVLIIKATIKKADEAILNSTKGKHA